jgi:hypothetical protein
VIANNVDLDTCDGKGLGQVERLELTQQGVVLIAWNPWQITSDGSVELLCSLFKIFVLFSKKITDRVVSDELKV